MIGGKRMKYDDFVAAQENLFAFTVMQEISDVSALGKIYNPLYLYAQTGCGKTHLVSAFAEELEKHSLKTTIISAAELTDRLAYFLSRERYNKIEKFCESFSLGDAVVVEDVQSLMGMESTQDVLARIVTSVIERGGQVILTADVPIEKLSVLDRFFKRNFAWGLVADIEKPGVTLKYKILETKAEKEGLYISEKMKQEIVKVTKSINQLEGILQQIKFYDNVEGRETRGQEISDEIVMKALGPRI